MTTRLGVLDELMAQVTVSSWREDDTPLEARGVSRSWLIEFVSRVQSELNEGHAPPASFSNVRNDADKDQRTTPYRLLNTHSLVENVIKPFTEQLRAPLYAFVPERHRGVPQTFMSHTWSSLLLGPERQRVGTLDALRAKPLPDEEYLWVDFVCYNQHLFESIAGDMAHLISRIGTLSIVATPLPLFTRSWCLWELLCAHRAQAHVEVRVESGWRNDKILCVNSLYRSFAGLGEARSTSQLDQADIYNGFIETFGSEAHANEGVRALIEEKFADPWFELQDSKDALAFSVQPFAWGDAHRDAGGVPFFLPDLLACKIYGEDRSLRDYFRFHGVLPTDDAGAAVYDSRQDGALVSKDIVEAANAELRTRGEGGSIEARAFDVEVVTPRRADGEAPTANQTIVRMKCPSCGGTVEVLNRPAYLQSDHPESPWSRFIQGHDASDCACGFRFRGAPSFFAAETWTAATLEPPPGLALGADRYAALVEDIVRGRDLTYPLLVFERNEAVRAVLQPKGARAFAAIPYHTLVFGDYGAVLAPLLRGAAAVASGGRADVGYSMLRNACFVSVATFYVGVDQMSSMARAWDGEGRGSDLFDTLLVEDLRLLAEAVTRGRPPLNFARMFFCLPSQAPDVPGLKMVAAARGRLLQGSRLELVSDGNERCSIPTTLVAPMDPDALVSSKLDSILISAQEYLRRSKAKLSKNAKEEFEQAGRRLNAALRALSKEDCAHLEAHYNSLGLNNLRHAVRQSWF